MDNGFTRGLKSGKILLPSEIDRFEEAQVNLKDGRKITPDVIICGTGYSNGLEELVGHLDVLDESRRLAYSRDGFSSKQPGLWFFGFENSFWGNLNERRREARRLAQHIARY